MQRVSDLNNLYRAFVASKRNSGWKAETQKFEMNWLHELSQIQKQLVNGTYKTKPGNCFTLNERGKVRRIVGRRIGDRIVRHSLCDNVLSPFTDKFLIYDNSASRIGRGISFARNRLLWHLRNYIHHYGPNGYILLMDFSKYYDNIQHSIVKQMFKDLGTDVQRLLSHILSTFEVDVSFMSEEEYANCMNVKYNSLESRHSSQKAKFMQKSVDIGDQTSQVIGIYYPIAIDNYIKIVRSQKYYARYMDDSYIIANNKEVLHDLLNKIKAIAQKLGIFINPKKTQIFKLSKGFRYLQNYYFVTSTGKVVVKINKKRVTAMRRKLKKLAALQRLDLNMFKGWMGGYYKTLSAMQRNNLINLFNKLGGNYENNA